ncbi:hypothetical protein [Methylopila sp. M107]|uniref:hypothetical protein n=1 Tax=Methylopila sp. M107 TaxID=1101190 RepID=UPI000376FD5B|nr:hypothetical protein [Methylopila sp. M107]
MKKTLLYALAGVFAVAGVAETAPQAVAEPSTQAPRTLEQLRDRVRADGMSALQAGDLQTVTHRRYHRRRYAPRSRYSLRYIHRRGRWCSAGRYYGRRCKYTPRVLRPFRQG